MIFRNDQRESRISWGAEKWLLVYIIILELVDTGEASIFHFNVFIISLQFQMCR